MQTRSQHDGQDYLDLWRWASETPESTALAAPGREPLTHAGLYHHVHTSSAVLSEAGVRPGSVAVLALPNGPEFVTAALAIMSQSACAPLDPGLIQEECEFFLTRLNAATLVCAEGVDSPAAEVARELRMRVVRLRIPRSGPAGLFSVGNVEIPVEEKPRRQTDAALLFHTSATTSTPKLVPRTRLSVHTAARQDAKALQLSASDRFLSLMPLCYGHGISMIFSQLICGGSIFCAQAFDPAALLQWFAEFRPTWFSASPAMLRTIVALARENPDSFRRAGLRFVRSAGAAADPGLIAFAETLLRVPVLDGYGLTEAPSVCRATLCGSKPGSVGKSAGPEVAIMDESGRLLPPETEGEIVLRGPTVMSGYIDNPGANRAAFCNGWFRTGDVGKLDEEGFLYIAGRRKEMINRGGEKISPREIDAALAGHPAIADAASFAVPHRSLGEDIAAAVVLLPGATTSELELRRYLAERLAAFKVPRRVIFVERIPRTPTGKPRRTALSEQFRTLPGLSPINLDSTLPSRVETQLIQIWGRILGIQQISVDEDFFALGGDSLSASLMLAQVGETLGFDGHLWAASDFFDKPTVQSLSRMIAKSEQRPADESTPPVLWLRREGSRSPFFYFSNSALNPHQFHYVSRWLSPDRPIAVICPPPAAQNGRLLRMEEIARQSVASIRAIRGEGPYLLGGYCHGGVVAFEAARQLVESGAEVALLALFDTPTPGYPKIVRDWSRFLRQGKGVFHALLQRRRSITPSTIAAHFRALGRIVTRRFAAKAKRGLFDSGLSEPPPGDSANSVARREYVPRALAAPIVHFIGARVPVSAEILGDPRLGWRDFTSAGFQTCSVPGDHAFIFSQANAPALASGLDQLFEAADPVRCAAQYAASGE